VGLLFIGQLLEIATVQSDPGNSSLLNERLLSSQRDAYLSGGVLMLFMCMSNIYGLIRSNNRLKAEREALIRQAQAAASFAEGSIDEKRSKESKMSSTSSTNSVTKKSHSNQHDHADILRRANSELKKKIKSLEIELDEFKEVMGERKKKNI